MRTLTFSLFTLFALAGCGPRGVTTAPPPGGNPADKGVSLAEARQGFQTKIVRHEGDRTPAPKPPAKLFGLVRYESKVGPLAAYLTPGPTKDGKKHPAIVWITGGD